jgi:hypothetical protein
VAPDHGPLYGAAVKTVCPHLVEIRDVGPGKDVCESCIEIGGTWVHLRQCLICGRTGCCDSSPNRHASRHAHREGHPIARSLEPDEDWAWCFVDDLELGQDETGAWQPVDSFFDAGASFARDALESGLTLPFDQDLTAPNGFPLGSWEATYRDRRRAGTLDPDQAEVLEGLPGWQW